MIKITAAFTGPRPKSLCGYNKDAYSGFIVQLKDVIRDFYREGVTRFISGGAQGFDQLAFWAVEGVKRGDQDHAPCSGIQNIVYVPFEGQEQKWAEQGTFGQSEYRKMLRTADEVKVISAMKDKSYQAVAHALQKRNEAMIDDAEFVIALFNGRIPADQQGGTANAINYAVKSERFIRLIRYRADSSLQIRR